jgi:hypothetical protein
LDLLDDNTLQQALRRRKSDRGSRTVLETVSSPQNLSSVDAVLVNKSLNNQQLSPTPMSYLIPDDWPADMDFPTGEDIPFSITLADQLEQLLSKPYLPANSYDLSISASLADEL